MKRIVLSLIIFVSLINGSFSQNVGISAAGAATDNSAGLDVNFTNKGLLIPRVNLTSVTDITTITTPATSLLVYNENTGMVGGSLGYWYWNGVMWIKFRTGMGGTEWALNGNSGTTVGTNFLGTTDAQDFAIYTSNAERIRVQSGGNVGIGTASPQRLFHVLQNSSGTPSMFALDNPNTTDGNGMSLSFRGTTTGAGAASFKEFSSIQSVFDIHEYTTRASSLVFFTSARGFIAERMRIDTAGNIGIGNDAPKNALHVTSAANPLRLVGLQTGAATDQIMTVDATGVVHQQTAASLSSLNAWSPTGNAGTIAGTNFLGTTDAQDFAIYTNNVERIRVQSGGNVGIGTTNPQRLFHLSQSSTGTPSMFALDNPSTTDGNGMSISFRGTTTGTGAATFNEFSTIQSVYSIHDKNTATSSLRFLTTSAGSLKERMRINTNGFMGIGTQAPLNALHIVAVSDPLRLVGLQTGADTDQILSVDATGVVRQLTTASILALNTWSPLGNAGTVDSTNFIGTTDNVPFNIRVNNQKAGRIDNTKGITAFGYQSLNNNTASNNTAIGHQSLFNNTTGGSNTANGNMALFNNTTGGNNTANGFKTLYNNTAGTNNTANGIQVLYSNTTGNNNTASGYFALYNNTSGGNNTANGFQALYNNTTGGSNTGNGYGSLLSNTTGSANTAYGFGSLRSNITGANNTAMGYGALFSNTTGGGNAGTGFQALYQNTTGNYNTANGFGSLFSNTAGGNNTASGYFALYSNTTGGSNTAYGINALYNNNGSFNSAHGAYSLLQNTTGENNTANGYNALNGNTTGSYNTANGSGSLSINTTGSYNTANGYEALFTNTTGSGNTANGFETLLRNTTGSYNTASGFESLFNNTTGSYNTGTGNVALFYNTTGVNNTASGFQALYQNTTGSYNTANGYASLGNNTEGVNNTANGYVSLRSNTTGNNNTASGYQALYSSTTGSANTGTGYSSLFLNTTGGNNTANGYGSLSNNTTGSSNTSYGYRAGAGNISGSSNTFIGYLADVSSADLTNATSIGYSAIVGASNSLVLGGTGPNQVSVGIGTTTPNSYLETAGSFGTAIITTTSSITLNNSHYTVIITGGLPVITLPVAGPENNRRSYRIINQRLLLPLTISPYIDFTGLPASTVPPQSKIEIQSNGINWYRVD